MPGPRGLTVYRSARGASPYLGRGSYWAFSAENARCLAAWGPCTIPDMRPRHIYVAEIAGDDAVFDATQSGATPRPEVSWLLCGTRGDAAQRGMLIDDFAKRGFRWLLITEDRFKASSGR